MAAGSVNDGSRERVEEEEGRGEWLSRRQGESGGQERHM